MGLWVCGRGSGRRFKFKFSKVDFPISRVFLGKGHSWATGAPAASLEILAIGCGSDVLPAADLQSAKQFWTFSSLAWPRASLTFPPPPFAFVSYPSIAERVCSPFVKM